MIEIYNNLFIGNQNDYDNNVKYKEEWAVIHACKEPYHRKALGYTGRGAPKNDSEYLIARRDNRLILNLIDPDDYKYIPKEIIDSALTYIDNKLENEYKVLVHCNQGESRAPGIGLLYLAIKNEIENDSYKKAVKEFVEIYPFYKPSKGIRNFLKINWDKYIKNI